VYQFDPDARPDDQLTAGDLRWLVPLEDVTSYQFEPGGGTAPTRPLAESHFNSERAGLAALLRRRLPIERLFMTFLETAAMNTKYLEAEAILFADGGLL
jgi:hypothetical protein